LAVGVAVGLCSLWALAVAQQVGFDALADTIRKEAAYRFAPKAGKGYPWGEVLTFSLLVFAAHLPVSAFALQTFRPSFWAGLDARGKRLLQLLHCWTWPNLLFWALVPGHNVRYALPLSAGLMGLGVLGLWEWLKRQPTPQPPPCREGEQDNRSLALAGSSGAPAERSDARSPLPAGRGPGGGSASPPSLRGGGRGVGLFLLAFLLGWAVAKVVFVEIVVPQRTAGRNAEGTAAVLRQHTPDGPLYIFKLKDEGVTFYFARPVHRLADVQSLPPGAFALLTWQEWEDRAAFGHLVLVSCMHDQQGDPIYLVKAGHSLRE
ncbi:MAG: hypothetical protein K2V38_13895, partial [Gemmataceae bacterium]|nr:hypothetical protein [Gemmataceae bacterium]